MISSRRPAFPDKVVGMAIIAHDPGSRDELLVGPLPYWLKDQAKTQRDNDCTSYTSKEGMHDDPPLFCGNSYRNRAGGNLMLIKWIFGTKTKGMPDN
jgi:hypothetical protein